MHYAASSGQVEVLQYLHKYLPEHHLNLPDQCQMPPLVHAVNNSRLLAAIYLLLGLRAETEFTDNTGCTLLHWACYQGNLNIVKVLDHMGVLDRQLEEKDNSGQTPIFKTLIMQQEETLKYLFKRGADYSVLDNEQLTPRMYVHKHYKDVSLKLVKTIRRCEMRDIVENARNNSDLQSQITNEPGWRELI